MPPAALRLAIVVTMQGDAGVLPAHPVSPLVVARGSASAAAAGAGAVFLNPAAAAASRGLVFSLVSYPRTELEGFSVVGVTGGRIAVVAGLWAYSLSDIFDPEVLAQDPRLAELGLSGTAASLGTACRFGRTSVGVLATVRTQNIVGTRTDDAGWSVGMRLDGGSWEAGVAWLDQSFAATPSAAAPQPSYVLGAAVMRRIGAAFGARLEAGVRGEPGSGEGPAGALAPQLSYGPFEVAVAYSSNGGWSGGAAVTHGRWRVDAGTNFVGRDRLDHRVALGVTFR
jgi:hypothetical protein